MGRLVESPADFAEREFWDKFFKQRGGVPFEWYGQWEDLQQPLSLHCGLAGTADILVPACGNSELSASMYDSGFHSITNIDFSKVVVTEMLRKHLRARPRMLWRVMDITDMQFPDGSFDVVLDKGGLDALLGDPEQETNLAVSFLSEVKRVLKSGGKYACVTLAQSHVIGLLLANFRHNWKVGIHLLPLKEKSPSDLKPFLIVAHKEPSTVCSTVTISFDPHVHEKEYNLQMVSLLEAVETENKQRAMCSIEEAHMEDLAMMVPGRRLSHSLVTKGALCSSYPAFVLDAQETTGPFEYGCAVFLVPKGRAHEWLFSSVEGQWQVAESAKAKRLIMVFLHVDFYSGISEDIRVVLSPLVRSLYPADHNDEEAVPYLMCGDGGSHRRVVGEMESPLTGAMLVEDVAVCGDDAEGAHGKCTNQEYYRRLVFRRNPNLIQSEALLIKPHNKSDGKLKAQTNRRARSAKKKVRDDKDLFIVDHSYLASPYHSGMIAGLALIALNMENWVLAQKHVRVGVVGVGAGLLPMFLHRHFPFQKIQVIELDPLVGQVAKEHFGFIEDDRMELCIGDGIRFVEEIAKRNCDIATNSHLPNADESSIKATENIGGKQCGSEDNCNGQLVRGLQRCHISESGKDFSGFHILFIDADSEDPSTGLSCPPAGFLEESFLMAARNAIYPDGMVVINLVSRAKEPHLTVPTRLKQVFAEVYSFKADEDCNRVLFALPSQCGMKSNKELLEAVARLEKVAMNFAPWGRGPNLRDIVTKLISH